MSELVGTKKAKNIIVCDLDGTIALDDHRAHLLADPKNRRWEEYFQLCTHDAPNYPIIQLLGILRNAGKQIYILTGRTETVRFQTTDWLGKHRVVYDYLHMRGANERSDDHVLKLQWCKELGIAERIWLVLEDRKRVVESWRNAGYTCLQVRPGDF